jgi:transposase
VVKQKVGTAVTLVLLTDLNRIHREAEDEEESKVQSTLQQLNISRFFLPPSSPQLNPLESLFVNVKNKVSKREVHSS